MENPKKDVRPRIILSVMVLIFLVMGILLTRPAEPSYTSQHGAQNVDNRFPAPATLP